MIIRGSSGGGTPPSAFIWRGKRAKCIVRGRTHAVVWAPEWTSAYAEMKRLRIGIEVGEVFEFKGAYLRADRNFSYSDITRYNYSDFPHSGLTVVSAPAWDPKKQYITEDVHLVSYQGRFFRGPYRPVEDSPAGEVYMNPPIKANGSIDWAWVEY